MAIEEKEEVKTNLITAVTKNDENKVVMRRLLGFMIAEAIFPIGAFYFARNVVAPYLGLSKNYTTIFAAAIGMIVVNIVIFCYIFLAFREDDGPDEAPKESKKNK